MNNRQPLTQSEKERLYRGKLEGRTLTELAMEVGCSFACARKWWRMGRDRGLAGLRALRRGRGVRGPLSQFEACIAEKALQLKQAHKRWGADRVRVELQRDPDFQGLCLPSPSSLALFFKARCPDCVAMRKARSKPPPAPAKATGVHEVWQLDSQEKIELADGQLATICNIRDPRGAAMIASQAFAVKTKRGWRKLAWTEVRQVLREAFTEWQTLPDEVLTDNELGLAGSPNDVFPGKLTLWLVGLGIWHACIRPGHPTDQPQIERNHQTLDGWALDDHALQDLEHLQQSLDCERQVYNQLFPSQASDCAGRPPLTAHPELLRPRRFYQPELELILFDLQRAFDYLATFTFERVVNASAQVSLGRQMYSLGKQLMRERKLKQVRVRMDAERWEWVFLTENGEELVRRSPKGIDVESLTGLEPQPVQLAQPVQLMLPFLAP